MRASVFVGTSLDGFLARPDDGLDFLSQGGGEGPHGYEEFFATVDALVFGRRTYDVVAAFPEWPYGEKRVFVLSGRKLDRVPENASVERLAGSPAEIVSELERRGVTHAYVDGGLTIQAFLRAGLIQRLTITRIPVLIGAGIPLFGPTERDIPLRLLAVRQFGEAVQCEYEVVEAATKEAGTPA